MDKTIYERFMELPLFKGVSKEDISVLLEKFPIAFHTHDDGEILSDINQECREVFFVMSGNIAIEYLSPEGDTLLSQTVAFGAMLGSERLFGMSTSLPYRIKAIGKCGLISLTKQQILKLLSSNNLYLVNFLNSISLVAQKGELTVLHPKRHSLHRVIADLILVLTRRDVVNISFNSDTSVLSRFCGIPQRRLRLEIETLLNKNLITIADDNSFTINSRSEFLDGFYEF